MLKTLAVLASGFIPPGIHRVFSGFSLRFSDAIRRGVNEAVIIDGRVPHSILLEMFSDRGSGTLFYRSHNR